MNAKGVIREVVEMSDMVVHAYVGDLTDAELLVRSVPGTNHIAWQVGHLLTATRQMLLWLAREAPELPAGFAEAHSKDSAASDDRARFAAKAEYLRLIDQMKAAVLAAIDATPEGDLDKPGPEPMREYAPTVGSALMMLGAHWLMHAGQFVPIRRKLGKPALF